MTSCKRFFVLFLLLFFTVFGVFAQQDVDTVGAPNPNVIGVDSAQQKLREISVSKFEDAGFWEVNMSPDQGLIRMRRFEGGPVDKTPIPGEVETGIADMETDRFVLGLKVQYYGRGYKQFSFMPVKPIPIEGITKTLSVWVVGRNFNHELFVLLQDQFGNYAEVPMGLLNFSGWRQLTIAIPPSIRQRDYHFSNRMGIKVLGFLVRTDPAESYGSYYIYFDALRAVTDLFSEEERDVDDFTDAW